MKILIIRTFPNILNPENYNVQEIGLAKALTRAGHQCGIVLYNGKNKSLIDKIPVVCGEEEKEILIYKLRGFNLLKNGFFFSLNKVVKQYDIIQVHEYDQITSWFYYAWSKKKVVIYHGPYYDEFNKGYNLKCKIFDNIFLKIRHNRNVQCLTKSNMAKKFLEDKGFKHVTAVGVGLDSENLVKNNCPEDLRIYVKQNTFTLIYIGKIEKRRNSLFLAEVMNKVTEKYSDISCIVVGDGEPEYVKEFLNKVSNLITNNRLQYYKKATQMQLADLYKRASLMLFPSNYEIFGMVLAEAVYFGLPVISTLNGGSDMLITCEEEGKTIIDFDVEKWVDIITEYYKRNKKQANDSKNCNSKVLWDNLVDVFINGYCE